jgi:hypothetical protein
LLPAFVLVVGGLRTEAADEITKFATATNTSPFFESKPAWVLNGFGRWSYFMTLIPYYVLLGSLAWRYRVIWRFANWWFFFRAVLLVMVVLGFALEFLADVLYVWDFPPGRDFGLMYVPIFGWFSGNKVPVCELGWILGIGPLFYYLWFWATLVFHDVIYVMNDDGTFYKKEERWVGFHGPTRIRTRRKNQRGQENERTVLERPPGFIARSLRRRQNVENP